jgi:hypothetical protein
MVDLSTPRCRLSLAASASFYFLFLRRLVLVYIREQRLDPLVSVHPETQLVAVTGEAFVEVAGEVVDEDKAFVEGDVAVVGDDGDAADSKDYYVSLGGAIEVLRFPSAVLLGTRILDSSRGNIVTAKRESRGN